MSPTNRRIVSWVVLVAGAAAVVLLVGAGGGSSQVSASSNIPFVSYREVLPVETRLICTPYTQQQKSAYKILGWDGWGSVQHEGRSYWIGGDVMKDVNGNGTWEPPLTGDNLDPRNLVAYTTTTDVEQNFLPANRGWSNECFTDLTTKTANGQATELLPLVSAFEPVTGGAFPTGFVPPASGDHWIYFFYDSAKGDPYEIQGVGLAKMCAELAGCTIGPTPYAHFESVRVAANGTTCDTAANCLFWKKADCNATVTSASAIRYTTGGTDYAYIFVEVRPTVGERGPALARVPISQIENKTAYQYYDEANLTWVSNFCQIDPLWSQEPYQSNSASVSWNAYLNKYLAVYTQHASISDYTNLVAARTASQPEGPWSAESIILDCARYFVESDPAFPATQPHIFTCYTARQHPEFEKNGGQTIYISNSNSKSYRPYVQRVVLGAKPVYQYSNPAGQAAYRIQGASPPAGFGPSADGVAPNNVAFYAVPSPIGKFNDPIYEWTKAGEYRYGPRQPQSGGWTKSASPVFYAIDSRQLPTDGTYDAALYNAVYRWDKTSNATLHAYSPLHIAASGFGKGEVAFFAICPPRECDLDFQKALGYFDTDGDGCPDVAELQRSSGSQTKGGMRDPYNPWDYFNPSGDLQNRVDDTLLVVHQYFKDQYLDPPTNATPNPAYDERTDRTLPNPTYPYLSGPPNGQQRVDDIQNINNQYFHDCQTPTPTNTPTPTP